MDTKTLIDRVAASLEIPREKAAEMLDAMTDIVGERCADLDSVAIPGFGSFEPKKKNAVKTESKEGVILPPFDTLIL